MRSEPNRLMETNLCQRLEEDIRALLPHPPLSTREEEAQLPSARTIQAKEFISLRRDNSIQTAQASWEGTK
jgi:hypothetical protein